MRDNKIFVIALGGSIMHPDELNVSYLKEFYYFIISEIASGKKFIIIAGGGAPARKFQRAAQEIAGISDEDKDWIGIHATRLNAHLLRTIFSKHAHPVLLKKRKKITSFENYSMIIGAGWEPGWSTDFVAVQAGVDFGASEVIILGKPDHVYDKDNQKFTDAKPFDYLSWAEYQKLIPSEWTPGMSAPIDPIAAKLAEKESIAVIVASGKDLNNLKKILGGEQFIGTTVK